MRKFSILVIAILALNSFLAAINLEECRKQTVQNNRSLKIDRENRKAAELSVKSAFTDFLPKVSATGSYAKMNEKFKFVIPDLALPIADASGNVIIVTDPEGNPVFDENGNVIVENWAVMPEQELEIGKKNIYVGSINVTQPIFTGGKLLEKYQISKCVDKIAESKEDLTRQELILKSDEYFWRVISIQQKVKLANGYKAAVDRHVADLQNYLDEGVITSNDMLKSLVVQNEADLELLKAENGLKLSEIALNQLLGNDLDADISCEGNLDLEEKNIPIYEKNNRAEVAMLSNAVKISNSVKRIALGQYLPNVVMNWSYFWMNPNPYNSLDEEFGSDWSFGIAAEMELFGWNKRGFNLARAEHNIRAAKYELEEAEEMISMQITQEKYKQKESLKKVIMTNSLVKQAEKNLEVNNDKFDEGFATSSDLLDAQTMWQNAVSENIDAKTEYQIQNTKLQKALGCL